MYLQCRFRMSEHVLEYSDWSKKYTNYLKIYSVETIFLSFLVVEKETIS